MSLFVRIIFFGLTGVIAGIVAWPFAELVLFYQAGFPSLLLFNCVLGITVGLFMGACFGTSEGIISHSGAKIRTGISMGIIIGAVGGLVGFVAGQAALLLIGTTLFNSTGSFERIGLPVSKAVGWGVFGIYIGIVEGVRSRSIEKSRNGIIGGFIGGIIGGLIVEYIRILSPENYFARLIGLSILGLLIGIFYGFIENKLSKASLRLLNGRLKGREFLLSQRLTKIGESEKTEIGLAGYRGIDDVHLNIKKEKGDFVLTDAGSRTGAFVNDDRTRKTKLHDGDIIRIGDAQFEFRKK